MSRAGNVPFAMTCIGKVYMQREEFGKAIEIQKEAYEIAKKSEVKLEMTASLLGLAETYFRQGDITSSIATNRKAEKIAEEIGANYELREVYRELSDSYAIKSDYKNAYKYLSLKHDIDSSLLILSEDRQTELMNFSNNILKQEKEAEIEVLQQQSMIEQLKSRKQKAFTIGIGSLGLLLLVLAVRFYKQTQYIKGINVKIKGQHDEIEAQRDEIEAQRDEVEAQRDLLETQRDVVVLQKDEIIDSINYAKRIQSAMLPPEIYITELLNENFILYKPRDIISGDFYWIKQVKEYIILAAADCTGHGVPGALMSMLGISYLNEIAQRREITQANQILNELRKQIKFSLRQHGKPDEAKDGIDMALCVLDLKNMRMQYAGANSPLYLIRDVEDISELKEIKADRMPIGYYQGKDKTFTNHDIQLEIGDTFYIFSDGYIDQKGGKDNKKFMSKNFKNLLLEIHDQPMYDQKDILDKTLSDWMGRNSQIDDILVIGVRV
jgi:serine phosphatase RsbU (regulator of sigma subunit)